GKVTHSFWYGEIRLTASGRISEINETSGEWNKLDRPLDFSPAKNARNLLRENRPDLLSADAKAIAYDLVEEHLNPEIDEIGKYARHQMKNDAAIMNYLELIEMFSKRISPEQFAPALPRKYGDFQYIFPPEILVNLERARQAFIRAGLLQPLSPL